MFLDIQATIECGLTLKRVSDVIRNYSQMHHTDKYSEHSSLIWPVWPNGWVLVSELIGSGFDFRFRAFFELGVSWHSGNYEVWIHSKTHIWQEHAVKCTVQISTQNTAQSLGQFGKNGWVFIWERNGSGFDSSSSHINFRFCASFEQGLLWHSGKYRVWTRSETRMWHDKSIQSNAHYR